MPEFDEKKIVRDLNSDSDAVRRTAFGKVVEYFSERLYWQIRRLVIVHDDANDLLQNVFVKAWLNLGSFKGNSKLSTWLYRIAINESITFINKERQHSFVTLDSDDANLEERLEGDPYFDGGKTEMQLQKAILSLPLKQRTIFNMRYFDEMKYEDISKILGTSVGALKASYHIAVKKVEEYFERED